MSDTFAVEFEKVCPMCSKYCGYFEIDDSDTFYLYGKKMPKYKCRNQSLCGDVYRAAVKEMKINEGSKAN